MRELSSQSRIGLRGRALPEQVSAGVQLAAVYAALAMIAAVLFGTLSFHPF